MEEGAAAVVGVAAGVEEEEDDSRVVRTLRAPWTPRVGLLLGDLSASSGTPKEESRTSGRQRYHCVHTQTGWFSETVMEDISFKMPCFVEKSR